MQWGKESFRFCRRDGLPLRASAAESAMTKARRRERENSRPTLSGSAKPKTTRVKERRYRTRCPATLLLLANRTPLTVVPRLGVRLALRNKVAGRRFFSSHVVFTFAESLDVRRDFTRSQRRQFYRMCGLGKEGPTSDVH